MLGTVFILTRVEITGVGGCKKRQILIVNTLYLHSLFPFFIVKT